MMENNPTNVESAFEILLEEIEAEIDLVTGIGARAFAIRDLAKVDEARDAASTLTEFRDKVSVLRKEWEQMSVKANRAGSEASNTHRRDLGRLGRGLRTPEAAYYQSILKVLAEMGGKAKMREVLDKVGILMKPRLRDVDFQPLASDPEAPRWRNAAQWARYGMIKEGLLKEDSPHGVWEISDAGRRRLRKAD